MPVNRWCTNRFPNPIIVNTVGRASDSGKALASQTYRFSISVCLLIVFIA
ncbi:MAG: hypothetical protein HW378_1990 [Anaerolineales bacterium]|jgi:hypothetical protein|nr:hypothetical protein [Anaerolineales bacterium]